MNKLVGKSSNQKNLKLALGLLFSTLLLTSMMPCVAQTSGGTVSDYWAPADKVYDEAAEFFDDSYIHEIRLYFDDPNWYDTLFNAHDNDRNTPDPYFPARFVSHGYDLNPVGARFKGLSTFGFSGFFFGGGGSTVYDAIKKPFRIDFNLYDEEGAEETTFFGLKKLNLNNCALDPSLFREKLFMDFASKYVPTPRSVFTHLYVNDEYFGLYLAMEHIDKTFVRSRFGDNENGNIYKAESQATLTYKGPDYKSYSGSYELKNNEELNDWSDLIELTNVLTNTPISELPEAIEPILDVESTLYAIAMVDLFVNLDSYIGNARNYYLYHRSDTGQFILLLWDANLAFGNFLLVGGGTTEYTLFPTTMSGFGGGGGFFGGSTTYLTLTQKLFAVPAYNTTYLRMLAQMLREGFDANSISARSQQLSTLIRDAVYADPNLQTNPAEFDSAIQSNINFVAARANYVNNQLNKYAKKTDLKLNELMTVNQGIIADNMGDYDPWVEIYNLGPGLVNTGSLFLTDELGVPNKWALPYQNLDDGEFLLLWLDGEPSQGANHAPFRLNPDGGNLYLYVTAGSGYNLVDSISYPELDAEVSFGRFPDGDGIWRIMNEVITPALPNQYDDLPTALFINEFMANNDAAVPGPDGDYPDWIELYNGGTEPVDLSGMYLTDNLANPDKWQFPAGTVIEPKGFLVIWADNTPSPRPLHASFGLNASGEAVGLFASDGETLIDSITFGAQDDDVSFGRLPDGSSSWNYLTPTPGAANRLYEPVTVEIPNGLFINEFMANNDEAVLGPDGNYPDWIELYNGGSESIDLGGMYLSDDLTRPKWQFPAGTVIEPKGFLVIWADNSSSSGSLHANFGLSANGEEIGLFARDGQSLVDSIVFDRQMNDISYGRFPDGSSNWNYLTPTPGLANVLSENGAPASSHNSSEVIGKLFINEFMAVNRITIAGPDETYPDWIELYNAGNETIDLSGMYLTDNLGNPTKWRFPNGVSIAAGGYLLIWADNSSDRSSLHTGFALNANGEEIGLFASDGETLIDSVVFLKQLTDVSYGRLPDGSPNWDFFLRPTPGWGNDKPQPGYEISVESILLLIGILIALSAIIVVAGKINARRK